jgi:molybdopterin/thiamine biosynthesis adenylyltransferase
LNRYHRQILLPEIGPAGQDRLSASHVLLVGCGALGSVLADQLVRAGVGSIRIVDRDVVELTNLQRQVLFDEEDARQGVPKAVAAARRLERVNSQVRIEPVVADVHAENVEELSGLEPGGRRADLVLDGTDNVETRYLLNDVSVKHGVPWVYGACVGTEGRVMTIRPPHTPCLRCVFPEPPEAGELPTCDTAGVLGPVAAAVASIQAVAAIKLLTAQADADSEGFVTLDPWAGRFRSASLADARRPDCVACGRRQFEFLDRPSSRSVSLCGRNAVQVRPSVAPVAFDLDRVAAKLRVLGRVEQSSYLVRCELQDTRVGQTTRLLLTVFCDGRAIIQGTSSTDQARSIYARAVGS